MVNEVLKRLQFLDGGLLQLTLALVQWMSGEEDKLIGEGGGERRWQTRGGRVWEDEQSISLASLHHVVLSRMSSWTATTFWVLSFLFACPCRCYSSISMRKGGQTVVRFWIENRINQISQILYWNNNRTRITCWIE